MKRARRQSGFALMIVMMLVAFALVLGLAYVTSASVKLRGSANLLMATRARYAAESGLEHAKYVLETSPTSLSGGAILGPYSVETGGDTYRFWATPDLLNPGCYTVTSEGTSGTIKQRSSARVQCPQTGTTTVSKAVLAGDDTTIYATTTVQGDVHANGRLTVWGHVQGNATYRDSFTGLPGNVTGTRRAVGTVALPDISWGQYSTYRLNGTDYFFVTRQGGVLAASDPLNNGGAITGSNCGGVVRLHGSTQTVVVADNVNFRGTLVSSKSIVFDGNITIESLDGFPAVVADKGIYVTNGSRVTIKGVVVSPNGIAEYVSAPSARVTVEGAVVSGGGALPSMIFGQGTVQYNAQRAWLYDFGAQITPVAQVVDWLQ